MVPDILLTWPFVLSVAALALIASFVYGRVKVSHLERALTAVATELVARGIDVDASAFVVTDPRHIVVVTATNIVIVDVERSQVVQQLHHADVHGLRIAEGGSHITFSLMLGGGAESRRVSTHSIAEFSPLFQMMAGQGKTIDFIPEKAA